MNFFDLKNIIDKVKFVKVSNGHNTYLTSKKLDETLKKLKLN